MTIPFFQNIHAGKYYLLKNKIMHKKSIVHLRKSSEQAEKLGLAAATYCWKPELHILRPPIQKKYFLDETEATCRAIQHSRLQFHQYKGWMRQNASGAAHPSLHNRSWKKLNTEQEL